MTALGIILGFTISGASALLLPLIFPATPKKNELSEDLDRAARTAHNLQLRLEQAKRAAESEATAAH